MLKQWIKGEVVQLPEVDLLPQEKDMKYPKYYLYHRKIGRSLERCYYLLRTLLTNAKLLIFFFNTIVHASTTCLPEA